MLGSLARVAHYGDGVAGSTEQLVDEHTNALFVIGQQYGKRSHANTAVHGLWRRLSSVGARWPADWI
jgi:hypothetical protein